MAGPGRSCDVYAPRLILYCDRRDSLVAFEIRHASLDRLGTGRKNEESEIFPFFFSLSCCWSDKKKSCEMTGSKSH